MGYRRGITILLNNNSNKNNNNNNSGNSKTSLNRARNLYGNKCQTIVDK